jgi:DNA-binding NarL/FixJ family response regulator
MLCQDCPKKDLCVSLCPEAELIANQDEVKQHDSLLGLLPPKPFPKLKEKTYLTKREREIVTLLGMGLSREDVCKVLEITRVNLRNHLCRIKKKHQK